jgi:hypothetical protein
MAIKRQGRFYSQERLSVPAIRDIEAAVAADFDSVLRDMVAGTEEAYLLKGFGINIGVSTFSQSADNLTVDTEDAAILHTLAIEAGTLLKITGSATEALNSTNSRVSGAFIAGSTNYISIDFIRVAATSTDTIYFFDKNSNTEFSKNLPVSTLLDYKIVINTTGFTGMVPVAIVTTNSGNTPTQITDARNMFFRLGTGGLTPDQYNDFPWLGGRTEPGVVTTSSSTDPFTGADKQISTFKQWMDAMMTSIKEIKGTSYWFSSTGSSAGLSLATVNADANLTVLIGDGTLTNTTSGGNQVLVSDDTIQITNVASNAFAVVENFSVTIGESEVLYLSLNRYVDISGNVTISPSGTLPGDLIGLNSRVIQASSVGQLSSLTKGASPYGDWVKSKNDEDNEFQRIIDFYNSSGTATTSVNATYLLLENAYGGTTGTQQIHYNQGYYGASALHVTSRAGILDTFNIENIFWLAYSDNSNIYVHTMGKLVPGEERPISENTSNNVLDYIGSTNEALTYPIYADSIDGAILVPEQVNYGGLSTNDLTIRTSILTTAASNQAQNKNIVLLDGGTVENSSGVITWSTTATIMIGGPGTGIYNTIAPGSCNLSGTNDVAFIEIDRNDLSVITVSVTNSSTLPLTENTFVIARKLPASNDVWVGVGGLAYLIDDGSSSVSGFTPTSSASLGFGNIHKWRQRVPTGTIDGVNTSFTYTITRPAYSVTALLLFKNGLFQTQGSGASYDYSVTNTTNLLFSVPPNTSDEVIAIYAEGGNVPYLYVQSITTISVTTTVMSFTPSPSCSYTAGVAVFINGLLRQSITDYGVSGSGISFSFNLEPGDVVACFYTGVNDNEISKQASALQTVTSGRTIYTFDIEIAHEQGTLLAIDGVSQFPINNTYGLTSSNITVTDYRFFNPGSVLELNSSSLTTGSVVYLWTR